MRGLFIAVFFFTMTPLIIAIQWLIGKVGLPGWGFIASSYYRVLCALMRINVRVTGAPARKGGVLYICNHVSWADILVIGSLGPVAFVAKREVADWPLVGATAKLQRTIFVDRQRRQKTGDAVDQIVQRLAHGVSVVLFAEGTSSDGNRVLPFRSALLGSVEDAAGRTPAGQILIQPMSIAYTGSYGIPLGRQHRPLVAWYGDLDFMPHIKDFVAKGAVDAVVSYGEPVPASGLDRKALTRRLEADVRRLMTASLRGRPVMPVPAPVSAPPAVAAPAAAE